MTVIKINLGRRKSVFTLPEIDIQDILGESAGTFQKDLVQTLRLTTTLFELVTGFHRQVIKMINELSKGDDNNYALKCNCFACR